MICTVLGLSEMDFVGIESWFVLFLCILITVTMNGLQLQHLRCVATSVS